MTDLATATPLGPDGGPGEPSRSLLERPPGWFFHAALAATLVFLLWSTSTPGWLFEGWFYGVPVLGILGLVWLVMSLIDARSRRKHGSSRTPWVLLVAPGLVVLAFCLVAVDAPLTARWYASRPSFEQVVAAAPPATGDDAWHDIGGRQRIGLYDVLVVYQVRDAVIFYEASGGFLDDTGFACLPSGPFPELENGSFEGPQFEHLGGCWYTWTASW